MPRTYDDIDIYLFFLFYTVHHWDALLERVLLNHYTLVFINFRLGTSQSSCEPKGSTSGFPSPLFTGYYCHMHAVYNPMQQHYPELCSADFMFQICILWHWHNAWHLTFLCNFIHNYPASLFASLVFTRFPLPPKTFLMSLQLFLPWLLFKYLCKMAVNMSNISVCIQYHSPSKPSLAIQLSLHYFFLFW